MRVEIREGKVSINRRVYKGFKQYDHGQMEQALQAVYEKGLQDGKPETPERMRICQGINIAKEALVKAIIETKGIGEKRREYLVQRFRELVEEKYQKFLKEDPNV